MATFECVSKGGRTSSRKPHVKGRRWKEGGGARKEGRLADSRQTEGARRREERDRELSKTRAVLES